MMGDPMQLATVIAKAIWSNPSINPIRPPILNHMEGVLFQLYDTTQGLSRDSRPGSQRGVVVASGEVRNGCYFCNPTMIMNSELPSQARLYNTAKEVEREYNIAIGSLPLRIVLQEYMDCTLAGLRELVKEAGITIKQSWDAQVMRSELMMEHAMIKDGFHIDKKRRCTMPEQHMPEHDVLKVLHHQSTNIRSGIRCLGSIVGPPLVHDMAKVFIESSIDHLRLLCDFEQMMHCLICVVPV